MPRFHVTNTFTIEGRRLFILAGSIVDGEIRPGMFVRVPFNSALEMTAQIHSIEFAHRLDGGESLCLCIPCSDEKELEIWRGLKISDETFEVDDGSE